MVEFAIGIGLLIAMIASKRIWGAWIKSSANGALVWALDKENEQQHELKKVYDDRENIIKSQDDKWIKVEDIEALAK